MKSMEAFSQDRVSYNSIQVDNLKIFNREAGTKYDRVILLLHGFPASYRMYQPMLESSLSTEYRLNARGVSGHFAIDEQTPEVIRLTELFLQEQQLQ